MRVKREVSQTNRKFNSNWEERYFFINNNGKPVSCEVGRDINSKRVLSFCLKRHYSTKHKTYGKSTGNNFEITEGQPDNCLRLRDCTEDVLHVRNLQKRFLNYKAIEKRHTKHKG